MLFDIFPITNGCWVCQIEKDGTKYLLSLNFPREMKPWDCLDNSTIYADLPELLEDIGAYIEELNILLGVCDETLSFSIKITRDVPESYFYIDYDLDIGIPQDEYLDEEDQDGFYSID